MGSIYKMIRKRIIIFLIIIGMIYFLYPKTKSFSFNIMEETKYETEIFVNDSGKAGSTVFVIAGIHGNETAGINAANSLKNFIPKRGKIIILPKANKMACDSEKRTMHFMQDLNREFPGIENGTDTQRLAWEIVRVIERYEPEIVIDLHESAKAYTEGEYYLGNSIIFSPINLSMEIAMYILENINKSTEKNLKFTYFSGAPIGSINKEISTIYDMPVITIETNMEMPAKTRERQHVDIINLLLKRYGMDD